MGVFGGTATSSVSFIHDEPTTITVTSPPVGVVARPLLRVTATCADDDPAGRCMWLSASIGGLMVSGAPPIDHTFDLTPLDGAIPELVIRAELGGWTRDGHVRQTSFKGIELGRDPRLVVREEAIASAKAVERAAAAEP